MFLYAITDSRRLSSSPGGRSSALLRLVEEWVPGGVDAIQIREKDLEAGALEALTAKVLKVTEGSSTRVYVNARVDVAIATGADVHLPGGSLLPGEVMRIFAAAGMPAPRISIACHSVADVQQAFEDGASVALLAPIFGKTIAAEGASPGITLPGIALPGLGLGVLREACRVVSTGAIPFPVLALGGVTAENALRCVEAGAAGVAGIGLFTDEEWRLIARQARRR